MDKKQQPKPKTTKKTAPKHITPGSDRERVIAHVLADGTKVEVKQKPQPAASSSNTCRICGKAGEDGLCFAHQEKYEDKQDKKVAQQRNTGGFA